MQTIINYCELDCADSVSHSLSMLLQLLHFLIWHVHIALSLCPWGGRLLTTWWSIGHTGSSHWAIGNLLVQRCEVRVTCNACSSYLFMNGVDIDIVIAGRKSGGQCFLCQKGEWVCSGTLSLPEGILTFMCKIPNAQPSLQLTEILPQLYVLKEWERERYRETRIEGKSGRRETKRNLYIVGP